MFMDIQQSNLYSILYFNIVAWTFSIPIKIPQIYFNGCIIVRYIVQRRQSTKVNPKGNQPWIFIGRTDADAEAPILWSPDAKSQLTEKDPDVEKDWRQERATEDEMVGWHHWLNRYECEQISRNNGGQRSLVCYSPWGHK